MSDTEADSKETDSQAAGSSSGFASDVLKLISGTTFSQALSILIVPFLSRLYSPADFGLLGIFLSITVILSGIAAFGYNKSVVLPKSDDAAITQVGLSVGLISIFSAIVAVIIFVWGGMILELLNTPSMYPYLWMIAPTVMIMALFATYSQWEIRQKHFGLLAVLRAITALVTSGGQLILGLWGYKSAQSLIVMMIIGQAVPTFYLSWQILRKQWSLLRERSRWYWIRQGIVKYQKFPLYDTWSTLLNSFSWQTPTLLLSVYFSPVIVGYYAMGNRILRFPMSLIGRSFGQVFFQRAAQARIEGTLSQLVEAVIQRMVSLGLYPSMLLTLIGRELCIIFLGPEWAEAGVYIQILSLWMFLWLIASPLSPVFYVLNMQDFLLKWNIVVLITRVLSLIIGGYLGNARLALLLFAFTGILTYGYLCYVIIVQSDASWMRMLRVTMRYFLWGLMILVPVGVVVMSGANVWTVLIVSMFATSIYYLLIVYKDPEMRRVLRGIVSLAKYNH